MVFGVYANFGQRQEFSGTGRRRRERAGTAQCPPSRFLTRVIQIRRYAMRRRWQILIAWFLLESSSRSPHAKKERSLTVPALFSFFFSPAATFRVACACI